MNRKAKISIPREVDAMLKLAQDVLAKHEEMGASSPLHSHVDMEAFATLVQEAALKQREALRLRRQAEKLTQLRNQLLGIEKNQTTETPGTILTQLVAIKTILAGVHHGRVQVLGDFGFSVSRSGKRGDKLSDNLSPPDAGSDS